MAALGVLRMRRAIPPLRAEWENYQNGSLLNSTKCKNSSIRLANLSG